MLLKPNSVWGFPKQGFAHLQEQTTCQRRKNAARRGCGRLSCKCGEDYPPLRRLAAPGTALVGCSRCFHTTPAPLPKGGTPSYGVRWDKTCHGCDTCTWLCDTAAVHLIFLQCSGRAPGEDLCDTTLAFFQTFFWESTRDYEQSCCHDVSNGRHGFVYGQCLLRPSAAQAPCAGASPCAPPRQASSHQALRLVFRRRSLRTA